MTWSISYSDGSANGYRFEGERDGATFEYIPVRPEQSSTGMYSGGEPRAGRLAAPAVEALRGRVTALEANAALHVADRMKGTGRFAVDDGGGVRTFIIRRGPELSAFDAFVASL